VNGIIAKIPACSLVLFCVFYFALRLWPEKPENRTIAFVAFIVFLILFLLCVIGKG